MVGVRTHALPWREAQPTVASGYTFNANQGLGLSGVFSTNTDYSIAFNSRFDATNGYRKIVDFSNRASDN